MPEDATADVTAADAATADIAATETFYETSASDADAHGGFVDGLPDDASSETSSIATCVNRCIREGALRCGDATHIQICETKDGCPSWRDQASCGAEQMCCGSVCVAISVSNCYTCGRACSGDTPVCDAHTKGCNCDEAACMVLGKVCDPTKHACGPDPARPDIYVDGAAGRREDGTIAYPYRSITAALAAPRMGGAIVRVHIAPGRYDAEHGETFPLVLRGAFLEGAGQTETLIVGTGPYDTIEANGALGGDLASATIVAGDATLPSGIAKLTLYDPTFPPASAHYGVVCDRGDARASGELAVSPNTRLDQITVGPGYDTSVIATTSTIPKASGCSLQVTGSTFRIREYGLWGVGCENPSGSGSGRIPVAIQLGDETPVGQNEFAGLLGAIGTGVRLSGCVTRMEASYNRFTGAIGGVKIRQPGHGNELNHFFFRRNKFNDLQEFGLALAGSAVQVDDLSDNTFTSILPLDRTVPVVAGLLVEGLNEPGFPYVAKATNNRFEYNQAGIVFRSEFPLTSAFVYGSTFQGGNVFHCNAADAHDEPAGIVGGDVIFSSTFPRSFNFDDNEWDHTPPTESSAPSNGADLTKPAGTEVSTNGATSADLSCPLQLQASRSGGSPIQQSSRR